MKYRERMKHHRLEKYTKKLVSLLKYRFYLIDMYEHNEIQLSFHGKLEDTDKQIKEMVDRYET